MTSHREGIFVNNLWVEKAPLKTESDVPELGLSSAPLESMSFYFAKYCSDYVADFMLCKNESTDPKHCLKEGRRVTRCAIDLASKLNERCGSEWKAHWSCLDMKNHHFWQCRDEEKVFSRCVKTKIVCY